MKDTINILNGIQKLSENQAEFMNKILFICTKLDNINSRLETLEIKSEMTGTDINVLKKGHNDIMLSIVNAVEVLGKQSDETKKLVNSNTYDIEIIKNKIKNT